MLTCNEVVQQGQDVLDGFLLCDVPQHGHEGQNIGGAILREDIDLIWSDDGAGKANRSRDGA